MGISNISTGLRGGICTSTTRPQSPYEGQLIYETDTNQVLVYDGAYWVTTAPQRNLLINGAMQVAQRGTSASGKTTGGYYTADRWKCNITTQGTWTQSVENDAPTGSGFRKSLKMLCTTADASPASGDLVAVQQLVEGQNLQALKKGTASAEQFTISFWVKSNVTGTHVVAIYDNDNTRAVSKQYTISASGTWEFKSITFPADTTGAFDNDNATSFYVEFCLGAGSSWTSSALQSTWGSYTQGGYFTGQTNVAAATNNYWQITGVQMNVGANASPFEFKDFGRELRECQRYYEQSYDYGVAAGTSTDTGSYFQGGSGNGSGNHIKTIRFVTPKRYNGYTMTGYRASDGLVGYWVVFSSPQSAGYATPPSFDNKTIYGFRVYNSDGGYSWITGTQQGHWVCDAEL